MDSKKTVLINDDEPDMIYILRSFLTDAGYEVLHTYGAESALRKTLVSMPDLVVTDLAMPGMSGVHLIEILKNDPRTKHIPIIAVTAFIWDNLSQAAGAVGCDGFVSKPFNSIRLLKEVRRVLDPDLPVSPAVATVSIRPTPKAFN